MCLLILFKISKSIEGAEAYFYNKTDKYIVVTIMKDLTIQTSQFHTYIYIFLLYVG